MEAVDKIYGTRKEYDLLCAWLKENKPEALTFMYHYSEEEFPYNAALPKCISNFPQHIDMWLLEHCPLQFVVNRIKEQYGIDDESRKRRHKRRRDREYRPGLRRHLH